MKTSANKTPKTNSLKLNGRNSRKAIIAEIRTTLGDAGDEQPDFLMDDFGGMF